MSDMPWFQFYAADWLSGTRSLSAAETGIYITLIASMYDKREALPYDPNRLARLCGASARQLIAALEKLKAEGKIIEQDGGLWNERVEDQLAKFAARSEKATKANNLRWGEKNKEKQRSFYPNGSRKDSTSNPNQNHKERRVEIFEVKKGDDVKIEQGSKAFKDWEKHLGKSLPVVTMRINGRLTQGWFAPTEYPPQPAAA